MWKPLQEMNFEEEVKQACATPGLERELLIMSIAPCMREECTYYGKDCNGAETGIGQEPNLSHYQELIERLYDVQSAIRLKDRPLFKKKDARIYIDTEHKDFETAVVLETKSDSGIITFTFPLKGKKKNS